MKVYALTFNYVYDKGGHNLILVGIYDSLEKAQKKMLELSKLSKESLSRFVSDYRLEETKGERFYNICDKENPYGNYESLSIFEKEVE